MWSCHRQWMISPDRSEIVIPPSPWGCLCWPAVGHSHLEVDCSLHFMFISFAVQCIKHEIHGNESGKLES